MKHVIKNGNRYSIADVDQVKNTLPVGTYNLKFDEFTGFYLEQIEDFKLPPKIYGDLSLIERSIEVYKHRDRNFGLLLSGLRGSGKSLLMKKLAIDLHQPIININNSFAKMSNEFISFLTDPALGDCTILFDEFEKKFDQEDVTPLTLLDGPYTTHHFFILTCNTRRINENLVNRPGRIYYHKQYSGLDDDLIREVGEDLLDDKSLVNELVSCCEDIRNLSFDMLISVIHDINYFHESPKKCLEIFGFDTSEGCFMKLYQKLGEQLIDLTPNSVWRNPTERYFWASDVQIPLLNGKTASIELRLDLSKMEKLSKNKYKLSRNIELDDVEDDLSVENCKEFRPVTIEFEINLNVTAEHSLIF